MNKLKVVYNKGVLGGDPPAAAGKTEVEVLGLDDDEFAPPALDKLLTRFGFECDGYGDYMDMTANTHVDSFDEVLLWLGQVVSFVLVAIPSPKGVRFGMGIDKLALIKGGTDPWEVYGLAVQKWIRAGRTINGVKFMTAVKELLVGINKTRGATKAKKKTRRSSHTLVA